jgi:hypothetical protein
VPVIGGLHFIYPWGAAGNILAFFLSGFPGGVDYFMLSLVKVCFIRRRRPVCVCVCVCVYVHTSRLQ